MNFKKIIFLFFQLLSFAFFAQTPYDNLPIADKILVKEGHSPYFTNARLGIGTNPIVLTTGPEQDCNSAIPVCQNIYSTTASYSGSGTNQEIPSNTCLGSNELNSVWYTFTSSSAGNIAFNITPNVSGEDYDFALYNITGTNCSAISSGALTPVRCNFSATGGVTGLSSSGSNASEPASGPNQSTVLATTVGQTYVLIISNYSSSSNGYQLNFTPGTASIFDVTPPTLTSVSAPCGSNILTLNTSEQVTCASIAANGSDISISGTGGPYTITGANGVNCGSSSAQIQFTITPALTGGGPWVLNAHSGSDGNSFIDNCGNAMPTTTVAFNVSPATPVITGPSSVCKGSTFALSSSAAVSYTWSGAAVPVGQQNQQTISITANNAGTLNFQLVVSYGACGTATITKAVTITDAPIANFSALPSLTVCAGTAVTFTNTSTYPCSTGGLGINQCTCGTFLCQATSNQGTFATYLWTFGDGGVAFYLGGSPSTAFSPVHTYTAPGTYNVSLNASGLINTCSNTKNLTITVLPAAPVLTVSPTSTICPGQTSTLTATGGTTYTWTPGATLNTVNGGTVIATPTISTTYSVSSPGCSGNQTSTVQVVVGGTPPVIGAINGSTLICANSTGITYSVANVASTNYTWSVPAGATITSTPTNSNAITVNFGATAGAVSVTAVGSCGTATASIAVTLSPALNLTVTPNTTSICAGSSTTLTASGATNYTWSPSTTLSSSNGVSVVASPISATTYTVVGATGTCTGTTTATVSINPSLSLTVTPNNSSVCAGSSQTLTASGATNYTWSPATTLNTTNGASVIASPSTATTYTVIGSTGTCTGSATASISMSAGLTLTLTSNTPTVCVTNPSALLDVNGATSYTWFPSATLSSANGSNVTASPLVNTTYTVLGSTGTCTGVATINIGIGVCVSSACNLALIRSTLTAAGNIELLGMNNTCSLYFINPQYMTGPQAQAYAQTFGANLISVQSAAENADLVQALSNQGYSSNVIWIGFSDALVEGSFVWYDGSPISYTNWAPGEPNNAGGNENCTQIYPNGSWNDLNCAGYNSLSVIEVNICPQVSVVNVPPTHCPLTNVTMNASTLLGSPNYTYTWVQSGAETFTTTSTGSSLNDQITVNSIGPNTFTVFTEDRYSCPQSTTVSLNVFPTPTITANSSTICLGQQTATLTANGATTYSWIPGTGLSATSGAVVTGSPSSSQNYTVIGRDTNGCLNGTVTAITVNPIPTISVNSASICIGQQTATLIANGTTNYSWTPNISLSSTTGSLVTGTPTVTQTYSITGTDTNGCFTNTTSTITVNSLPTITANSATICAGQQTATLTANGATTYSWIPNIGLSSSTGATVIGIPSVSQTYTVGGIDANGCINGTITAITVNPLPTITVSSSTICAGQQTATLTANGATSYTWIPGTGLSSTTGAIVTGTPNTTQNYTVGGIDANGCVNGTTTAITVNNLPTITVNSASICTGQQTATLTANGANTYSWIPSANLSSSSGATVTGTPSVTENYTITGTDANGCVSNGTSTITVNSLPTITATDATICIGQQTATLTASGAATYSWIPGTGLSSTSGAVVTGTPNATQNYTVAGMDLNGCINGTVTAITVNPLPTVTVNSSTICVGQQTATLTANGATSYTWIPSTGLSATTGSVVTGTPGASQNYTVGGIDANGCINGTVTAITVNPLPILATSANSTVCPLSANTLTVGGAATYTWSPNIYLNTNTASNVICTPSVTTTYTIDATSALTCTNSTVLTIVVNNTVVVNATAATPTICPLGTTALNATGASSYTWSPSLSLSSVNGGTVTSSTSSTQTYTVIGATSTCTNSAQVVVTVTTNPVVSIVSSPSIICSGTSSNLTASGASTYTWSPPTALNTTNGSAVTANPNSTQVYNITGVSPFGCIGSTTTTLVVVPTPTVTALANPLTICAGKSSTLSAFGASNFAWTPAGSVSNVNGSQTIATPAFTTTYTVIGSNGTTLLCSTPATVMVVVTPNTTVTPGTDMVICEGQQTTIYATGGTNYTWTPSAGISNSHDATIDVQPNTTTVYTVIGTNNNVCPGSATVQVIVNPLPILNAGLDTTINIDHTVTLFGTGNVEVGFLSPDGTPLSCNYCPTITVNPQNNTCYTLEGINQYGCRNTDVVCVTVTKDWDVFIPNAFTPNGDLINEVFIPVGYAISEINLLIFDRWGNQIFKSHGDVVGWDGTNKGKLCEQGVYIYQAEITAMSGEKYYKTGHVTLLPRLK